MREVQREVPLAWSVLPMWKHCVQLCPRHAKLYLPRWEVCITSSWPGDHWCLPFHFTVQAQEPLFSPKEAAVQLYLLVVAVFRPLFPIGYWEFHRETTLLAQCRRGLPCTALTCIIQTVGKGEVPCPSSWGNGRQGGAPWRHPQSLTAADAEGKRSSKSKEKALAWSSVKDRASCPGLPEGAGNWNRSLERLIPASPVCVTPDLLETFLVFRWWPNKLIWVLVLIQTPLLHLAVSSILGWALQAHLGVLCVLGRPWLSTSAVRMCHCCSLDSQSILLEVSNTVLCSPNKRFTVGVSGFMVQKLPCYLC